MSLQDIASRGRYGDTMLIHISPEELGGLHALAKSTGAKHGLTLNPETGLYEAFSLKKALKSVGKVVKKALPTIVGAAATMVGGPALGALAGAAVGAITAPKGQALMGGITGALGGYGGGQLATALTSAGSAAIGSEAAAMAAMTEGTTIPAAEALGAEAAKAATTSQLLSAGLNTINPVTQGLSGAWGGLQSLVGTAGTKDAAATGLGGLSGAAGSVMKAAAPIMADTTPVPTAEEQAAQQAAAKKAAGAELKMPKYRVERLPDGSTRFVNEDTGVADAAAVGAQPVTGARDSDAAFAYLNREAPKATAVQQFGDLVVGTGKDRTVKQVPVTAANVEALRNNMMYAPIGEYSAAEGGIVQLAVGGTYGSPVDEAPPTYYETGGYWTTNFNGSPRYVPGTSPAGAAATAAAAAPGTPVQVAAAQAAQVAQATQAAQAAAAAPAAGFKIPKYRAERMPDGSTRLVNDDTGVADAAASGVMPASGKRTGDQAMAYLTNKAAGGTVALQSGGFVFPADVVSAIGAGSSGAGLEVLAKKFGARPVQGKGHGQSDDIEAHIDGKQRARVARDEAVLDAAQVAKIGGGDPKKGAKKLYDMMARVRKQATGSAKQMRVINHATALA